jgi:hypothetical protein
MALQESGRSIKVLGRSQAVSGNDGGELAKRVPALFAAATLSLTAAHGVYSDWRFRANGPIEPERNTERLLPDAGSCVGERAEAIWSAGRRLGYICSNSANGS